MTRSRLSHSRWLGAWSGYWRMRWPSASGEAARQKGKQVLSGMQQWVAAWSQTHTQSAEVLSVWRSHVRLPHSLEVRAGGTAGR